MRGYYQYYGIRGNYESLGDVHYQAVKMLYHILNRRSQRRSYTWKGLIGLLKVYQLPRPRIRHDFRAKAKRSLDVRSESH